MLDFPVLVKLFFSQDKMILQDLNAPLSVKEDPIKLSKPAETITISNKDSISSTKSKDSISSTKSEPSSVNNVSSSIKSRPSSISGSSSLLIYPIDDLSREEIAKKELELVEKKFLEFADVLKKNKQGYFERDVRIAISDINGNKIGKVPAYNFDEVQKLVKKAGNNESELNKVKKRIEDCNLKSEQIYNEIVESFIQKHGPIQRLSPEARRKEWDLEMKAKFDELKPKNSKPESKS